MTLNKENNTLTLQPESLQYIHKLAMSLKSSNNSCIESSLV